MALRTPLTAQPHLYIGDSTGRPLDYGRVYFGEPNKDPEFYPIDIYLDPEMTIAAAQPVRTKGGFMDVGGNLAELHAAEVVYSLKVLDQYGRQVFYKPEMYRNNVSDFLVDEITRATAAETLIAGNLTAETQRAVAAEKVIADAVVTEKDRAIAAEDALDIKHAALSSTINSLGGGKKAFTTYAKMEAAAALPDEDPLKLPANSSIDVTNDTDPLKNGTYSYDGAVFAKSDYDPVSISESKRKQGENAVAALWFTVPYYEHDGASLYFKARDFFARDKRFAQAVISREDLYAALSPKTKVVSPNGVADCIKLDDKEAILFDVVTGELSVGTRDVPANQNKVVMICNNYTTVGRCVEEPVIVSQIRKREVYNERSLQGLFYSANGNEINSYPYVEQSKGGDTNYNLYLKFSPARIAQSGVRAENVLITTWDMVVNDIADPSKFTTSPNGEPNCLTLKDNCLVWSISQQKFKINATTFYDSVDEILLATSVFGQLVSGKIYDWWMLKRVNKLDAGQSNTTRAATKYPAPKMIAHAGMNVNQRFGISNSIAAYRCAGEYGYWGAETDIVETKDGEWVHNHDLTLDAATNGTGLVKDYTLAELKLLDISEKGAINGWTDVPLMELSEFAGVCRQYNLVPIIEIKSVPTASGIHKIVSIVRDYMPDGSYVLMSFNRLVTTMIRDLYPNVNIYHLCYALTTDDINYALSLGNCGISAQSITTPSKIKEAQAVGLEVNMWTLNQDQVNSDLVKGLDSITTNESVLTSFNSGTVVDRFKSNATYSNMTDIGTGTVAGGILSLTDSGAYLSMAAERGDVITVTCEGKYEGEGANPLVLIHAYDSAGVQIRKCTQSYINNESYAVAGAAVVLFDDNVASVRVTLKSIGKTLKLREIKIKRHAV